MDWLQLPSSKSDVRNNVRESVSIHDVSTLETVKAMVELQTACQLVTLPCWTRSGSAFRSLFRRILLELEVEDLNFRPCSLRQGGATYEMQSHGLMEKTLIRGRWRNSNVARIYISDGLSRLPSLKTSWHAKHQVAKFSSIFTNEHHAFDGGRRGTKRKR